MPARSINFVNYVGDAEAKTLSGTAVLSSAFPPGASGVELCATVDCFIKVGDAPTAVANTSPFLPAGVQKVVGCASGDKVSVIQKSAAGILYISPVVVT